MTDTQLMALMMAILQAGDRASGQGTVTAPDYCSAVTNLLEEAEEFYGE